MNFIKHCSLAPINLDLVFSFYIQEDNGRFLITFDCVSMTHSWIFYDEMERNQVYKKIMEHINSHDLEYGLSKIDQDGEVVKLIKKMKKGKK